MTVLLTWNKVNVLFFLADSGGYETVLEFDKEIFSECSIFQRAPFWLNQFKCNIKINLQRLETESG